MAFPLATIIEWRVRLCKQKFTQNELLASLAATKKNKKYIIKKHSNNYDTYSFSTQSEGSETNPTPSSVNFQKPNNKVILNIHVIRTRYVICKFKKLCLQLSNYER
jgi:hypothetical protein